MTAEQHDEPKVTLMLPGEWISARPDDTSTVTKIQALAGDHGPAIASLFERSAAAGAVLLMFRVRSSPPVLLSVTWPRTGSADRAATDAPPQVRSDGVAIEHAAGYPCARTRESSDDPYTDALTYALTHPETGRLLVVRVVAFEESFDDLDVADYDLAVTQLTWEER